jgi:hypothetical protein
MRREKRVTALPPIIPDGISDSTNFDDVTHAALFSAERNKDRLEEKETYKTTNKDT